MNLNKKLNLWLDSDQNINNLMTYLKKCNETKYILFIISESKKTKKKDIIFKMHIRRPQINTKIAFQYATNRLAQTKH